MRWVRTDLLYLSSPHGTHIPRPLHTTRLYTPIIRTHTIIYIYSKYTSCYAPPLGRQTYAARACVCGVPSKLNAKSRVYTRYSINIGARRIAAPFASKTLYVVALLFRFVFHKTTTDAKPIWKRVTANLFFIAMYCTKTAIAFGVWTHIL